MADLFAPEAGALFREARAVLGIDRLVLGIHSPSFPGLPEEDGGRGSPYSSGARRLLELLSALGFDGVQLGPMGKVSQDSDSPYEGTLFSRNPLDLSLAGLVAEGLLDERVLAEVVGARPEGGLGRVSHAHVFAQSERVLEALWRAHVATPKRLEAELEAFFQANAAWLVPDALYEVLSAAHGGPGFERWTGPGPGALDGRLFAPGPGEADAVRARMASLSVRHAGQVQRYAFEQLLIARQHRALRETARSLGLTLYGDLQIGFSDRDVWARQALFLADYRMGAPPSRTNPEGQPWGYRVLDPARYDGGQGPVAAFVRARVEKLLSELDGLRIDHPHGWVCPWVYRADEADGLRAVQGGARLFSSPKLPDHPSLSRYAIVRPDQLDRTQARYADGWVRALEPEQVERYAALFDVLMDAVAHAQRPPSSVICEVLSTLPYPLEQVMARVGLGRFRVTQKAKLDDPADVYRSENAAPGDWIMLGNHDTPPIWQVVERWAEKGELARRAGYLAERLKPPQAREAFAQRLLADRGLLVQAQLADALASPARHVQIFFTDLFGLGEPYNVPGTVSPKNWSLRVPPDFRARYEAGLADHRVLNLPRSLALALGAPGRQAPSGLVQRLEQLAG